MKNKVYTVLIIFSFLYLASCNECPLQEFPPVEVCETGIVTLERFNPNFSIIPGPNPGEQRVVLDSDYCISVFEFSSNRFSTGNLPNDNRFKDRMQIPIASIPFVVNSINYYANIMDTYPSNLDLAGDILVRDINVGANPPFALLRIYGSISYYTQNFLTENAQQFCDYIKNDSTRLRRVFSDFTEGNRFGRNQSQAVIGNYDNYPIIITDENRNIIGTVGSPNVPVPPNSVINELRAIAGNLSSVDLRVQPGEMYAYIARNGRRFMILITEIRQTNITPFRKRITLMLNPLDKL